ncbi:Uncharacterised protein [Clostridioides difficile]|nr:Uncharacterised protein [Clostridioides difficile]SJV56991.1 Uncharacterised protein [Clostridioides difficile]
MRGYIFYVMLDLKTSKRYKIICFQLIKILYVLMLKNLVRI